MPSNSGCVGLRISIITITCNNDISSIIEFTTSNTDGNTTYTWTNDNTSIGLSSTGNGDIPSFTALNLSPITEVATITVTPTYENNGIICDGDSETFTIVVNPSPVMDNVDDIVLCNNCLLYTSDAADE